jgi:hypothetical protein
MRAFVYLVTAVCALTAVATTASAGNASSCQKNLTFQQAARGGALPAIYAALHGGAAPTTACATAKR